MDQYSFTTNLKHKESNKNEVNKSISVCAGSSSIPDDSSCYAHHNNKAGFCSTHDCDSHYYIAKTSCTAGNVTMSPRHVYIFTAGHLIYNSKMHFAD